MPQSNTVPVVFEVVGLRQLDMANEQLKAMGSPSGNVAKATKSTARFGRTAQNVGYQVQDMIVQIQGGVDPMRSMSQQLPQMLVGFGAWGAAIGVVAAALPALISYVKGTNEEIENTGEASEVAAQHVDQLAKAFANIGSAVDKLNLDTFVDKLQEATAAQEQLLFSTLEFTRAAARLSIDEALQAFQLPVDVGYQSGQAALEIYNQQLAEFAETVGLTSGEMIVLKERFEEALNLDTSTSQNLGDLVVRLQQVWIEGGRRNTQLEQTIELLRQAQQATEQLEQAESSLLQTTEVASTKKPVDAGQAQESLEGYNQALMETGRITRDFLETVEQGKDNTNNMIEQWSLAEEALNVFNRSFDTMLDGVLMGTTSLEDGIKNMVKVIIAQLAKLAAYQYLFPALGLPTPNAKGNVFSGGNVVPFARGGVVDKPTLFPMANGAGLMGEAGPEAILPLGRNSKGELGVKGGGVNVVVNNMAAGVEVTPRETQEGLTIDVVMASVSSEIRRGGNAVSSAIEDSYSLGRGRALY